MNISELKKSIRVPIIGAPLFIVSNPKLVIEQCKAGVIGSFPALNARPKEMLDDWLYEKGLESGEIVHRLHLALVASGMMLAPDLQDELLSALAQMDGRIHSTTMQRAVIEEFMLTCSEIGQRHGLSPMA